MKTNQITLTVGQLVKVNGRKGNFRYVGKNIVKEISSGKCISVCMSKISAVKKSVILEFIKNIFK